MALVHAQPLEVINVRPLAAGLHEVKSHSLLKTDKLQLMRVVLMAGQNMPEHHVGGDLTIQCLEGEVRVNTPQHSFPLLGGELIAVPAHKPHSVQAISDASLLLTVLLHQ
jgi:quercetin dioxygenase-like cupin family protein